MSNAIARSGRLAPIILVLVMGFAALALAGCGDDDNGSTATSEIEFLTPTPQGPTVAPASSAAPGASSTVPNSGSAPAGASAVVDITAKDTKFDKSTISVPAGVQVTVNMTNNDPVIHNISFYPDKSATNAFFEGELFKGPNVTKTEKFNAPAKAGTYYFHCDVHPDMSGSFIVQ